LIDPRYLEDSRDVMFSSRVLGSLAKSDLQKHSPTGG
jgi:hypothetical protein